jgi:hypothetical protein
MLKTLMTIALITALLSFTYMSNKIATLNALIGTLEAGSALLSTKNKRLVSQRNKTKRLVKSHRVGVTKRSLKRAAKKMAKAGATMLPFAGIAIVAAATADDIHDLCTDIQEARDLEQSLYGETVSSSKEEEKYCHEAMGEELLYMAEEARVSIARDFKISYQAMEKQAGEITNNIAQFGEGQKRVYQEQYNNTVDYWSRQFESQAREKKSAPADSNLLERTSEWWSEWAFDKIHGA